MTVVCDLTSDTSTEKHNNQESVEVPPSDLAKSAPLLQSQIQTCVERACNTFTGYFCCLQTPVFKQNTHNRKKIKALVDLFQVWMSDLIMQHGVVRLDTIFYNHGSLFVLGQINGRF